MNMVNGVTVILLVLLLDIAVIWSVIHSVVYPDYPSYSYIGSCNLLFN